MTFNLGVTALPCTSYQTPNVYSTTLFPRKKRSPTIRSPNSSSLRCPIDSDFSITSFSMNHIKCHPRYLPYACLFQSQTLQMFLSNSDSEIFEDEDASGKRLDNDDDDFETEELQSDFYDSLHNYNDSDLDFIRLEDIMEDMDASMQVEKRLLRGDLTTGAFDPDHDALSNEAILEILSLPDDAEPEDLEELERIFSEQGWEMQPREVDDTGGVSTYERRTSNPPLSTTSPLEQALLQGVVPVNAGVGSRCLPGDYGFDPLNLASKDYFKQTQNFFLSLLPTSNHNDSELRQEVGSQSSLTDDTVIKDTQRPLALIFRDYREAEIRHGRLAMLTAVIWPMQELIDRLFLSPFFGQTTFIYGGPTLPYLSLFMTLLMLLLGYLDIYATVIKNEYTGEAFLPGECFWDPLSILEGASNDMKRNMQERELNNGRIAMIAVLSYILQEAITHCPLISLPWNVALFEPAFEIPAVQSWLDSLFGGIPLTALETVEVDTFSELSNSASD